MPNLHPKRPLHDDALSWIVQQQKKRIITIIVALQVQIPRIVIVLLIVFIDQTLFQRLAFYHTRQRRRMGVQRETHSLSLAEAT